MSPGNASASENVHTAGDHPAVRPGVNVRASVINSLEVMDYERRLKASHVQFSLEACALSDIVEFNKPAESDVKNEDEHTEKTIQNKIIKILSEAVASRASDVHFRLEKVFCKICFHRWKRFISQAKAEGYEVVVVSKTNLSPRWAKNLRPISESSFSRS
ncbi:hypothetical protein BJP43_05335 [Candidatus Williamhamiltonella defendens]|nr:hypothetical protein BJP43_05335 [Candidatus Hamiltonella defensa]